MIKINSVNILIAVLLTPVLISAQPLKDPRTRDEDLSATIFTVQTKMLPSGMYEYIYDIESPMTNKGRMLYISIDIACDLNFGPIAFPDPPDLYDRGDFSKDGLHVPVRAYSVMGFAGPPSVGIANEIGWGLALNPGSAARGIRLVSPAPPGPRAYKIVPSMFTDDWDYQDGDENDPTVPWVDDFTVNGTTTGPACALTPPPDTGPMRYAGTNKNNKEAEAINNLLTYSAPLQSHFHVPAGSTEYALTIHYGQDIDAGSFKVKPKKIQSLFHPQPGTSETVHIPLRKKKTKLKFEVRSNVALPHDGDDDEEKHHKSKNDHDSQNKDDKKDKDDKDRFEIRVDQAE